jgi:hypothetical protein
MVSSAFLVRGFVTFGDSPPTGAPLVEEFELISQDTLHRGSQITNRLRMKSNQNKYTFWIGGFSSSIENPMGESELEKPWE